MKKQAFWKVKWKQKIAEILLVDFFDKKRLHLQLKHKNNVKPTEKMANEDSYCTRAPLTLEYNAESGAGAGAISSGACSRSQRHRLGPITPTSRTSRGGNGSCLVCCGHIFNYMLRYRRDSDELEQRYKSREIDKFLKKDKRTIKKQVILILYF